MKTNKDYTVQFRQYGTITVPKGTPLTHQTAMGIDKNVHFVNGFKWVSRLYPDYAVILVMDLTTYGIDVPKEYVDYEDGPNYYELQLEAVAAKPSDKYQPQIKVFTNSNGKDTNVMALNEESSKAIIEWLQKLFPAK